jgi:hypothetical protein
MRHPVLLALAMTLVLGPVAGAQTGQSTAGASVLPKTGQTGTKSVAAPSGNGGYDMLVDFTHNFMTVQAETGSNILSETLAAALQRSRDTVRPRSLPMPEEVKKGLIPFYPAELLENVRYAIGDPSQTGLAGFAIRNGNAAAVTLIDTVVFKNEDYVGSLALWAHEIHHVQQYKEWGVSGFASHYAFGWKDVEAEASARAKAFVAWYRERMGLVK